MVSLKLLPRGPLPTHSDMNGSAYNDFLPLPSTTINPSSYGRKRNNLSSYLYTKFPYQSLSSVDLTSSSPSFNKVPSHVALPPSTKVIQSVKSVCQKKSTSTSVQSYLQVPSSISSNKGSLAKFAARVGPIHLNLCWGEG